MAARPAKMRLPAPEILSIISLSLPAFSALLKNGFSFDLQLLPELMAPMAEILSKIPDVKVALCHAGSPYDRTDEGLSYWAEQLQHLSALPQVSAKLSGLGMFAHGWQKDDFAPITEVVLDQFGAARVMFGSNFPVCSLTSDYKTLIEAYEHLIPQEGSNLFLGKQLLNFIGFSLQASRALFRLCAPRGNIPMIVAHRNKCQSHE